MKGNFYKKILFIIIIFLLILVVLSFYLINKEKIIKHEEIIERLQEKTTKIDYQQELNNLKRKYNNNDIVGILLIENTRFKEIIMQSTDNDYYLNYNINHKKDWKGQAFLDYRVNINENKKLIIYGHNSPNYQLPFKIFEKYYDKDYIKKHKYLYLQTEKTINIYEIFSVYIEVSDWSYNNKMSFNTEEEYYNHILNLKRKSFYETEVNIEKDDEILIIQTCSTHNKYNNYENKFLLIIGKKI